MMDSHNCFGSVSFASLGFCLDSMADTRRARLTVDKTVGVADLEAILEAWLAEQPHRDLSTLLSFARQHTTWKTAPNHEVLAFYAPFFARIIERVPTAALPPKITTLGRARHDRGGAGITTHLPLNTCFAPWHFRILAFSHLGIFTPSGCSHSRRRRSC